MIDGACASAASTVWPSTPGAPLLRTTFSSALARLASDATSSSSRLVSATLAAGPLVFLVLALCSRKLRRSDASEGSADPLPEGLSANTRLNCRGPVLLNPSPPLLHRLSPASSLLRGDPTSAWTSSRCRCLLRVYRSRGPMQTSLGKVHWMSRRRRPHYRSDLGWILGVAFEGTLTRSARPAQGFTLVRCCGTPRASSPHGLTAPGLGVSRRPALRAVASSSRLLPTRPAKDFHLQSSAHARHTSARATPSLRDDPKTAPRDGTGRDPLIQ